MTWTARLRTPYGVIAMAALMALTGFVIYRWVFAAASWPVELENPRTEQLFSNTVQPTADDRLILTALVTEIARADPVVIALLDGQPWPEPQVSPVSWTHTGDDARSVLIGGVFQLDLGGADYQGPWPSAGCTGGRYRAQLDVVEATNLYTVSVTVDLIFERVTHVAPAPFTAGIDAPPTRIETVATLDNPVWYTGTCSRFSGPQ